MDRYEIRALNHSGNSPDGSLYVSSYDNMPYSEVANGNYGHKIYVSSSENNQVASIANGKRYDAAASAWGVSIGFSTSNNSVYTHTFSTVDGTKAYWYDYDGSYEEWYVTTE
jgi:hypothetical protein